MQGLAVASVVTPGFVEPGPWALARRYCSGESGESGESDGRVRPSR